MPILDRNTCYHIQNPVEGVLLASAFLRYHAPDYEKLSLYDNIHDVNILQDFKTQRLVNMVYCLKDTDCFCLSSIPKQMFGSNLRPIAFVTLLDRLRRLKCINL